MLGIGWPHSSGKRGKVGEFESDQGEMLVQCCVTAYNAMHAE